ncbi:ABC transporter permease [Anaerocolumna sp. MB42-C2]|uniref:ABC transporter permease n=1 Tax=Anaerocolumna sp. MB42-C2 TaxID=3070997 RepID=UPI0027DFB2FE|nr:ABC transporter permease [Anaerocolumna sp. MB42-C2]WMJ86829.1 ABC transporter permease [Anaerocolumna sp. MB42-C2]
MEKSSSNGSAAIQLDSLTKNFGDYRAVSNLSLEVNGGEIFGFLGLNGADKSTTIKMILSLLKPSSGSIYMLGNKVDPGTHKLWEQVGYWEGYFFADDSKYKKDTRMKILSFIHCEALKVLRSSVFWIVVVAFATMPIMLGLVTYINAVDAGWEPYLTDLLGSSTAILVIGFSFTACWVFGREYTDKTISELLVKPLSKLYVVLSKFIVIFLWDVLLAFFMFAVVFIMGMLIGLNGGIWLIIMKVFLLL